MSWNVQTDDRAIIFRVEDGVAHIELNRPGSLNAMRSFDKQHLADTIAELSTRARVIVLSGAGGRAFCAGADIKEMAGHDVAAGVSSLESEVVLFDRLLQCPVPIIAAIDGYALGLGLVIAACCDLSIATRGSLIGMPEIRNSVPAGMQTQILMSSSGLARTRWLFYSGEKLTADRGIDFGLINEVVPDAEALSTRVSEIAAHLVRLPARGLELQKRVIDSWLRDSFEANKKGNLYLAASAFADATPKQAIEEFLRAPRPASA